MLKPDATSLSTGMLKEKPVTFDTGVIVKPPTDWWTLEQTDPWYEEETEPARKPWWPEPCPGQHNTATTQK